jgi:uncharacterized SAM-binding protein YcdF (DUF218 family)
LAAMVTAATSLEESRWRTRGVAALSGAILGILCWLGCITLGLQSPFGLPDYGASIVAALVGAVAGVTRLRAALWVVAGTVALLLLVVIYTPLVAIPAAAYERRDVIAGRHVDAVVVMAEGVSAEGVLSRQATDRLLTGLRLVRERVAPVLVVARQRADTRGPEVTSDADQQRLIGLLGDSVPVFVLDSVFSSRDEALKLAALARQQGWATVAVVTSPLHSQRACATYEKARVSVVCVPSESRDFAVHSPRLARDRVEVFRFLARETAARVWYKARGWM